MLQRWLFFQGLQIYNVSCLFKENIQIHPMENIM